MILPGEQKPAALLHPMWSAEYSVWFVAKLLQAPNKLQFAIISVFLKCELISPFWADSKALQDGSEIRVGSFQTMEADHEKMALCWPFLLIAKTWGEQLQLRNHIRKKIFEYFSLVIQTYHEEKWDFGGKDFQALDV